MSDSRRLHRRSQYGRSISSSSRGTIPSEIFDQPYADQPYAPTVWSMSTAPSLYGPPPPLDRLVCEFVGYTRCSVSFDPRDVEGWIEHNAKDHLGKKYPPYSICWFCDTVFPPESTSSGDRRRSYRDRMEHIAAHFVQGSTVGDMRPDFYFLDHIYQEGFIDHRTFEAAKAYHEAPQTDDVYPAGWRCPPKQPAMQPERYSVQPRERYRVRRDGTIRYLN